jgi:thymidylate kinase
VLQPVIIFEGHDRAGKSTIAEAVAKELGTEVFMTNSKEAFIDKGMFGRDSSPVSSFNLMIAEFIQKLLKTGMASKPIIVYRSFLSEVVYSHLLGRITHHYENFKADKVFSDCNATIVYCYNSETKQFHDEQLDDIMIKKSIELYEHYKNVLKTDVLEIDTKDHDVERYVKQIVNYISSKEEK